MNNTPREKLLFLYTSALEGGDLDTLAAVLKQAESDPILAGMIEDINAVYVAEAQGELRQPASRRAAVQSSNGHRAQPDGLRLSQERKAKVTNMIRTIPVARPARSPLTFVATLLLFFLLGSILLALTSRTPTSGNQVATQTSTPTATATEPRLRSYIMQSTSHSDKVNANNVYTPESDLRGFLWYQAPNKVRIENYQKGTSPYKAGFTSDIVEAVANSSDAPMDDSDKKDWYLINTTVTREGGYWNYSPTEGTPILYKGSSNFFLVGPLVPSYGAPQTNGVDQVISVLNQIYTSPHEIGDGTEKILDRPVYVIEVKPKPLSIDPPTPSIDDRIVYYIDREYLIILGSKGYNTDGKLIGEYQVTHLEINPTIDPEIFNLKVPDAGWFSTELNPTINWYDQKLVGRVPFALFRPTQQAVNDTKLAYSAIQYNEFQRLASTEFYKRSDLLGSPVLTLWQGLPSTIASKATPPDSAKIVTIGSTSGKYWEQGNERWLQFMLYDTQVLLEGQTADISQDTMLQIAKSLTYIGAPYDEQAIDAAWRTVSKAFPRPVYELRFNTAASNCFFSNVGNLEAGDRACNLVVPQPPHIGQDNIMRQEFWYRNKPGVGMTLTEGAEWQIGSALGIEALSGKAVTILGKLTGYYQESDDLLTLSIPFDETVVVLQMRKDVGNLDDLLILGRRITRVYVAK